MRHAGRWALTLGLIALLVSQVDRAELLALFAGATLPWLMLALAFAFSDRVIATVRWWLLLKAKGVAIGFRTLFGVQLTATFLGGFLPTSFGSDAVRLAMLVRRVPRSASLNGSDTTVVCVAASIVDRVLAVLTLILLCMSLVSVVAVAAAVGGEPGAAVGRSLPTAALWMIAGTGAAACAGLLAALNERIMRRIGHMTGFAFGPRIAASLGRLWWAMRSYAGRTSLMAACAGLSAAVILMRLLVSLAVVRALGIDVHVAALFVVLPLAWVILILPISIGGLGLQEGAYVVGLARVGVPAAAALAMSLLEQVIVRICSLPGAVYWLFEHRTQESGIQRNHMPTLEPIRQ